MIKITSDNNSLKITQAKYSNNDFQNSIEVKVFTVVSTIDTNNIGTILEKYRNLTSEADEFFNQNKSKLDNFIAKISATLDGFFPDCIICFYPADLNRKQLLKSFRDKLTSNYSDRDEVDKSNQFVKKDSSKTITKDSLTKEDFILSIDSPIPIQRLLVVDDVINEGTTLNILLDLLFEKNLINNQTVIKVYCLYNRPKQTQPKLDILKTYRDNLKT